MKFFKENYSGEAYDKAEKKAADVEKTVEQTEGILRLNRESALEHSDRLSDLKDDATKARSRVEKLKG